MTLKLEWLSGQAWKNPNIDSPADVREAILKADCVLYNEATSGIYIQKMIKVLGIANQVKNKTERYPSAAALMESVGTGQGNEIGFGQIPAIRRFSGHGVGVVGPLPQETSKYDLCRCNNKPASFRRRQGLSRIS